MTSSGGDEGNETFWQANSLILLGVTGHPRTSSKFFIYCTHPLILPLPLKDHEVHGQNKPWGTENFVLCPQQWCCPTCLWLSAFESLLIKRWNCTSCMWVTWKSLLLDAVTALVTHVIQGNCSHSEVHDRIGCRWKPPWIPTEQNCSGICDTGRSLKAAWLAACAGSCRVKWFGMCIISSKLYLEEVNLSLFDGLI